MVSDTGSTSDLEEELPVFDFLQPAGLIIAQRSASVNLDKGVSTSRFPRKDNVGTDVMMISSDSDEEPYVPLAKRLNQRRACASPVPCPLSNGKAAVQPQPPGHDGFPETETALKLHEVPSENRRDEFLQRRPPERPLSSDTCPGREKWSGRPEGEWRKAEEKDAAEAVKNLRPEEVVKNLRPAEAVKNLRPEEVMKNLRPAEAVKNLRPEECIAHTVVVVDPDLLQEEGGGPLLPSLEALGCSCVIQKQLIPRSVSWMRREASAEGEHARCTPEANVVMQMIVEDFISLVNSYVQEERLGRSECGHTLTSWVQAQQRQHPSKTLGLVVVGLEKHFRSQKSRSQKTFHAAEKPGAGAQAKKRRKYGGVEASRVDVEEAAVHLHLHTGVGVHFLSTWKDFAEYVAMTTKAVAEAPWKREREKTGFSFCLESEWAGGQRVDRAGRGLLQVWKRQIQQLNRVSPDVASAVLAAYPSPQLLKKAYRLCQTPREKLGLLSDLMVRRGAGVTGTSRRVGPELSRRLALLMTSSEASLTL